MGHYHEWCEIVPLTSRDVHSLSEEGSGPGSCTIKRDVSSVKECQRLLGFSRGERMMEMVERVTGAPCACLRGEPCILIPRTAEQAAEAAEAKTLPQPRKSVDDVTFDAAAGF